MLCWSGSNVLLGLIAAIAQGRGGFRKRSVCWHLEITLGLMILRTPRWSTVPTSTTNGRPSPEVLQSIF